MDAISPELRDRRGARHWYAASHWAVVLAADSLVSGRPREALDSLCRNAWPCGYVYLRARGCECGQAAMFTRAVLQQLIDSGGASRTDPARHKFRVVLMNRFQDFFSGGPQRTSENGDPVAGEWITAATTAEEERFLATQAGATSAGALFDRRWAAGVTRRVRQRLEACYANGAQQQLWRHLHCYLDPLQIPPGYRDTSGILNMPIAAVKKAVVHLRARHRDILRDEISHTVATPFDVDDELNYLFGVLRS